MNLLNTLSLAATGVIDLAKKSASDILEVAYVAFEKTFDNAKDVVEKTHDAFAKAMTDDE